MSLSIGHAIWVALKPVIKIYLIIAVGYMLGRFNILTVEATRALSDISLMVLTPFLAFNNIVGSIQGSDIKLVGLLGLTVTVLFACGLVFGLAFRKFLPVSKQWRGGLLAATIFPNISDIPIAYLQTLVDTGTFTAEEGNKGVANSVITLMFLLLYVFNLGGFRLIEQDFRYKDIENCDVDYDKEKKLSAAQSYDTLQEAHHVLEVVPEIGDVNSAVLSSSSKVDAYSLPSNPTTSAFSLNGSVSQEVEAPRGETPIQLISEKATRSTMGSDAAQGFRRNSLATLRSIDLRALPPQGLDELIREYSNVDQYGRQYSIQEEFPPTQAQTAQLRMQSSLRRIMTSDATVNNEDIKVSGSTLPSWLYKFSLTTQIVFFLKNCLRPCAFFVIVSLIVAFVPWLKALFVKTPNVNSIKQAPDNLPPLNFVMDLTGFAGPACVPYALMMVGATFARIKIRKLHPGLWKTAVAMVFVKQFIFPIIGILWCHLLIKAGLANWQDDKMLLFNIALLWTLPTMSMLINLTASFTPLESQETVQLDCCAFF
ncbi:putative ATPase ECM3 Ecym_5358 [Eremothecium cymbalariae DBVPG|uniref:Uncharacterized protein n=1 Tax=Eremothecium cymbalariae (strain CBS 270.75 / DBVPG 7215 / KCTC 17166 / NRRL Y-17582) TaxID=931890 RepID=I6NDH4_ERECY|nr:hypothetical protein Ecym_5358 [Eremothecium cymbalariae DBVPG\